MRLKHFFCIIMLAAVMMPAVTSRANDTAAEAFISAPAAVMPLLDRNTRLDMIDYFRSNMNVGSTNALSGKSRITHLSPESVTIAMTGASTCQIAALPAGSDSLIAVISTVMTPAPDSKMNIYTRTWESDETARTFKRPELKDWLTPEGRKNSDEVEALVPFLLISYDYDPATRTLTMTNNTGTFLSEEVYEIVKPYLLENLRYRWNGKKFEAVK